MASQVLTEMGTRLRAPHYISDAILKADIATVEVFASAFLDERDIVNHANRTYE